MTRLAALLLAAAVLAPAAAAHASSTVLPTRSTTIPAPWTPSAEWGIAPKLMGERVGWIDAGAGTLSVWTGDPRTRRVRRIHRLRDESAGYFDGQPLFAASATRIAVSATMHQGRFLAAGAPGDLRGLDRGWWDLDGDRLLMPGDARFAAFVLDPVTGERTDVALPEPAPEPPPSPLVRTLDLAGDLLAFHQNREGGVMEWRTGRVLTRTRTAGFGHVAGLQPDGTVLWGEGSPGSSERRDFRLTTPGGEERALPLPPGVVPLLAGDRIVYHDLARRAIVLTDLTGRELGAAAVPPDATVSDLIPDFGVASEAPRPALSDFDGRRAVWSYQPCGVSLVSIWDVAEAPPIQPRPRCRAARLAGVVREQGAGFWRVPLRCVAPRLTGCATRLTLHAHGGPVATTRVDMAAGERRGVRISGFDPGTRRLVVTTEPALRPAPGERRRWRVRAR